MMRWLLAALVLVLPLRSLPAQDSALPAELAKLVPADSIALVQLRSATELAGRMQELQARFSPPDDPIGAGSVMAIGLGTLGFPGDVSKLDLQKPIVIAVTFSPAGPEPVPTFIVPCTDVPGMVDSLGPPSEAITTNVSGSYVAVSLGALAPRSDKASRLFAGAPAGLLSIRIDAAVLIKRFRPLIDMGLEQFEMAMDSEDPSLPFDAAASMAPYLEWTHEFLDSAELLDALLDVKGGEFALDVVLRNGEGSPLAKRAVAESVDWRSMAGWLDPSASIQRLACYDQSESMRDEFAVYSDALEAVRESDELPQEFIDALQALMDGMQALMPKFGRASAASADLGKDGFRMVAAYVPPDPKALIDGFVGLVREPAFGNLGFVTTEPARLTIAGNEALAWKGNIDFAKFLQVMPDAPEASEEDLAKAREVMDELIGKDGARFVIWARGPRVNILVGGDDAWQVSTAQRVSEGGQPEPYLLRGVERMRGLNPGAFMQMDVARILGRIRELITSFELEDEGTQEFDTVLTAVGTQPLPFSFYGGITGPVCKAGVSIDFEGLLRFMDAIQATELAEMQTGEIERTLAQVDQAIEAYAAAHEGKLPASLTVLTEDGAEGQALLAEVPKDPWGRPFQYEKREGTPRYRVWTLGADGKPGGKALDADRDNL